MDIKKIKENNLKEEVPVNYDEFISKFVNHYDEIMKIATVNDCLKKGYAPFGYGLADFSIIKVKGKYHLFHIPRVPKCRPIWKCHEHWIGHAVTEDFNTWITQDPALTIDVLHYYESAHVWAPYIYKQKNTYFMYYAGMSSEPTQTVFLATTKDPELKKWERYDKNPVIPVNGFDWHWRNENGHIRHARDAHVIKYNEYFIMYYTAVHKNGCPTVGAVVSNDLYQWEDIGPVLYRPLNPSTWAPESVNVQQLNDGRWVLIPSQSPGLEYYISDSPFSWHEIEPRNIQDIDNDKTLMAMEVIARDDDNLVWLVAFFEKNNNRLFLGTLNLETDPWIINRIDSKQKMEQWYNKI